MQTVARQYTGLGQLVGRIVRIGNEVAMVRFVVGGVSVIAVSSMVVGRKVGIMPLGVLVKLGGMVGGVKVMNVMEVSSVVVRPFVGGMPLGVLVRMGGVVVGKLRSVEESSTVVRSMVGSV